MKTLAEIKDEVAQRAGYNNWTEVCVYFIESPRRNALDDEVAESYARQAWKEACKQTEETLVQVILNYAGAHKDSTDYEVLKRFAEQIQKTPMPKPEFKV